MQKWEYRVEASEVPLESKLNECGNEGTVLGALNYAARFTASEVSAPQLAALASESLVLAVLPYVLARAWDEVCRPPRWR